MIKTYYPNPKNTSVSQTWAPASFNRRGISAAEWKRRHDICVETAKLCEYKVGDIVLDNKNNRVKVTGIVSNYSDYGDTTEWPKNDNPFIICTVTLTSPQEVSFCTYNYVHPIKLLEASC